jgi:endonuclease-3
VATILSAQCTDDRVNIVTKELFRKHKTADDFVKVPVEVLEQLIFSTGFYKAKAKNIKAMAEMVLNQFNNEIPGNMDELLTLPGVGRKTANVILGHCFEPVGIVVDTHVIRLSNRMGFVKTKNAEIIETELMKLVDKEDFTMFTHYFISHGRKVCSARKPMCGECGIGGLCEKKL